MITDHPKNKRALADEPEIAQADWVVLLHGLFATRHSMHKLELSIRDVGYKVLNWGYPTWLRSTDQHVRHLLPKLEALQRDPHVRSISFVTHSMGGILARCALHFGSDAKIKRLVMLAPPNRGSHLTRISLGPFAWFVPAIADLSEAPDSLPNRMETNSTIEIGVIAASHDFIVPVANTQLPNQREHCVVPSSHFRLPRHDTAVRYVLSFLQNGRFTSPVSDVENQAPKRIAA